MDQLKVPYTPWRLRATQEIVYRPSLVVELQTPQTLLRILSIVDSGADYCLFPSSVGTFLGLEINKGHLRQFTGVGGMEQSSYFHKVNLSISAGPQFMDSVGFSEGLDSLGCGILGQEGFFDRFEVRFNRKRRFFTLHW